MTNQVKDEHVEWSKNLFNNLKEGGVWAVPRSGLMFTKTNGSFALTKLMPWDPLMSFGKNELTKYQQEDYAIIAKHMRAAGISVTDNNGLLSTKAKDTN